MIPEARRHSPYQGLIPYGEEDASFFFGREKETRLIIANLFAARLTLLYGQSGVGKSSVLRAGVAHQLRQRPDLLVVVFTKWQGNPIHELRLAINKLAGYESALSDWSSLAGYLADCSTRLSRRLMILLDQFEEYFLYHPEEDDFTVEFSGAVMQTAAPISFLISLREDSLAKLDRFEGRIPIIFDNYLRIAHLGPDEAQAAIEKPIEQYNRLYHLRDQPISIEPALVNEVLGQLRSAHLSLGETGRGMIKDENVMKVETPYLQLVMTRLWNEEMSARSCVLRLSTLKRLGGAERIILTHLGDTMRQLPRAQRLLASRIFHYLVTPAGTKIALTAKDLASYAEVSPARVKLLLQRLSERDIRLLRAVETAAKSETSYEIFHDVLAPAILDWRARYRRSRRRRLLILPVIVVITLTSAYVIIFEQSLGTLNAVEGDKLFRFVFSVIAGLYLSLCLLIPLSIGFFIGRGWARAR